MMIEREDPTAIVGGILDRKHQNQESDQKKNDTKRRVMLAHMDEPSLRIAYTPKSTKKGRVECKKRIGRED
jgi:hypothetical protein